MMIKITENVNIESYDDSKGLLLCPSCGEGNLHSEKVTTFNRNEDDKICLVMESDIEGPSSMSMSRAAPDNPSLRRHGISISFWCEHCNPGVDGLVHLKIAQHKGASQIWWEFFPDEEDGEVIE
jgi:hypothetical protein